MSQIRYIDLFAGIGGFHYGIDRACQEAKERTWKEGKEGVRSQENDLSNERVAGLGGSTTDLQQHTIKSGDRQFTCVYSNEWDKYANSVYRRHYGECDNRDIRTVKASEIPDFDLLCGGFPCQAFSVAGKRGGFDDTRGTLFFEIARILKEKQPRLLLLENVKGLLSHDTGRTFKVILATLTELGYDVQWQVLNSKNFGVPQNRERVFIVGHLRGTSRPEVFPIGNYNPKTPQELTINQSQGNRIYNPSGTSVTIASQAGGLGAKTGLYMVDDPSRKDGVEDKNISPTLRREAHGNVPAIVIPVLTPDRVEKRQNGRRFKENGDPSFTLTGQDRHGILVNMGELKIKDQANTLDGNYHKELDNHGQRTGVLNNMQIRRLTPTECERLQGFPDGWTALGYGDAPMSDSQRYKMMGNAVTTKVVTEVVKKLL